MGRAPSARDSATFFSAPSAPSASSAVEPDHLWRLPGTRGAPAATGACTASAAAGKERPGRGKAIPAAERPGYVWESTRGSAPLPDEDDARKRAATGKERPGRGMPIPAAAFGPFDRSSRPSALRSLTVSSAERLRLEESVRATFQSRSASATERGRPSDPWLRASKARYRQAPGRRRQRLRPRRRLGESRDQRPETGDRRAGKTTSTTITTTTTIGG